ncbi:MAG: alpha/beta hydrolase [Fimbriimonas ginsengisoli]|nr:alpha/beta hydrolase [Fimbriimonas ginsengisoli]
MRAGCLATTAVLAAIGSGCADSSQPPKTLGEKVTLKASDGTSVFADLVRAKRGAGGTLVLLFHQARSNAAEYWPIVIGLTVRGLDCLIVNQRSGGAMFGASNPTAAQFESVPEYSTAYPDLEAALAYGIARPQYKAIVAWGSSYSACLVLRLAAEHPQVSAVVACSPGEFFGGGGEVARWASRVGVPAFLTAAPQEKDEVARIAAALPKGPARKKDGFFSDPDGVHGSSTFRPDKCRSAEAYWKAVSAFLKALDLPG